MIYDDYSLLKNVGYDINNSDDLFKLVCDNPRNAAKYFDILSLCYSVVDDSGFNKIWMPAETDENGNNLIYTGVFGIMYESPHYSSFKMRNWLSYDANGFGVLKISLSRLISSNTASCFHSVIASCRFIFPHEFILTWYILAYNKNFVNRC